MQVPLRLPRPWASLQRLRRDRAKLWKLFVFPTGFSLACGAPTVLPQAPKVVPMKTAAPSPKPLDVPLEDPGLGPQRQCWSWGSSFTYYQNLSLYPLDSVDRVNSLYLCGLWILRMLLVALGCDAAVTALAECAVSVLSFYTRFRLEFACIYLRRKKSYVGIIIVQLHQIL